MPHQPWTARIILRQMADNLIFPIGFDLEKGVADAQKQMDAALKRLQKTADSRPLTIPMSLDASKFTTFEAALRGSIQHITDDAKNLKAALDNSLQTDNSANINRITEAMRNLEAAWKALPNNQKFDINDRLTPKAQEMVRQFNELATASSTYGQTLSQIAGKIKRVADEEAKANQKRNDGYAKLRKTLGAQENSIANLSAKIKAYQQILNSKEIGSKSFERVAEKIRELTEQLDNAKTKVAELTGKAQSGASRQAAAVRQVSQEFNKQDSYLTNLLKKTAALWSIHQVGSFLTSVREVTAQFELQRVSLGAILQDQNKANQLFSEIKSFALKSPVSILDLTKYTKQLAAYKVGWDGVKTDTKELFEWTKKLTDVSVGLGVSMDRVVLAFGQVRATGYLRGCLGRGTSVKMFDGSNKKVEDVLVGDAIMGDDGQKRNVLSLVRNRETMYVVKFDGGSFRCNENHILTLYNINSGIVEDVYVLDYLKYPALYKGVKYTNGGYEYFDMSVERDCEDDYFGFEIDGNKRFIIEGNIVTHNSEVRQFTEMGVPIVEELAEKLKKLNGEAVTTEQVMDMISKRAISFDMVKEVFDDMTSAGGMFYNMQEKQGNTLFGMWAKLGDAASVMYSEIGNTGPINDGMKSLISGLTSLMKNWRLVAGEAMVAVASFGAYKAIQALAVVSTEASTKATQRLMAAKNGLTAAQNRLAAAKRLGNKAAIQSANSAVLEAQWTVKAAAANRLAANTTNVWTAAKYRLIAATSQLKAAVAGNWIMLTVAAVAAIGVAIAGAIEKATRLNRELDKIKEETGGLQTQSVRNFEYLAEAAVKAADGSKQQKDALDELQRTYGDILPAEALTIKNLRAMRGNYEALTRAIRENIAAQQESKALEEIKNEYSPKIIKAQKDAEKALSKSGFGDVEIQRFFRNIEKHYRELSDRLRSGENIDIMGELLNMSGIDKSKLSNRQLMDVAIAYTKIVNAQEAWIQKENDIRSSYEESTVYLGAYTRSMQNYNSWVQKNMNSGETMLQNQQNVNMQIRGMESMIRQGMQNAGLAWKEEWANMITSIDPNDLGKTSTLNINAILAAIDPNKYPELYRYVQEYQKIYEGLIPSDPTVQQIRAKLFAVSKSTGANIDTMRQFLWDGSTSVDDYLKTLNDQIDRYEAELVRLQNTLANPGILGSIARLLLKGKIEETTKIVTALKEQAAFVKPYVPTENNKKKGGTKGTKSDPRLQTLQEIANKMAEVNKEYDELLKKEGQTKALADTQKLFASSFKQMEATAKKYGFKLPAFEVPQTIEDVQKWYKAIMDNIKRLKLKNADKVLIELGFKSDKAAIDKQQKDIEKQLKALSDRISRTKTAKEFYEKILGMTGDVELAANVSLQIYGSTGRDLKEQVKEQFAKAFEGLESDHADIMPDVTDIINRGAYEELRDYIALLPEAQRKAAEDLVKAQQQMSVKQYEQWLKDLEKAKDYADKRIELSRYTANQIAAIEERIAKLDPAASDYEQQKAMLEKLIAGYKSREVKMGAELDYEQFKNSALYVQVFENLDNASKTTLENMRNRLLALKDQWKNLSPEKVKELTKRLEELDAQIAQRNPFKSIADNIKKLREMRMDGRTKEGDAQKAFDAEVEREAAEAKMLADEKAYEAAVKQYGEESDIAKEKRKIADDSAEAYRNAEKTADSAAENADEWGDVAEAISAANQKIDEYQSMINDALDGIRKMMEAFGASDEDMQFFDDVVGSLNEIVDAGQQAVTATANIMSGNPAQIFQGVTQGVGAVTGIVSGISNLFSAGKVKRANKEIKRQQQLLEQLEYTYGRLEAATDKVFGRDYLNNYNQQLKNLQAQQAAYEKQARAERSKGKKKDKDKIKEYEEQARETADKIKELQDDLVAHFTGSSRTDVARQMAKSWIDARASMSDTFAAIKSDYADMIKNMIVEGAAARVIENALTPVWDSMEKMLAKNDVQGAIDSLVNGMDSALNAANNGMEVLWKALEARGYDMKKLIGDTDSEYTGIAKSVAGATSEEILQLSGFVNTALYHTAYLPKIYEELVAMRTASLPTATVSTTSAGWTDWQQQAMDNYMAIQRNTADTVVECRRAANACEKMMKVIKTKGATSGFNVFLNA